MRRQPRRVLFWCCGVCLLLAGCGGLGGEPAILATVTPPVATEEVATTNVAATTAVAPVATEESVLPPEATEDVIVVVGTVSGRITNGTAGGTVPPGLPVTLISVENLDINTRQTLETTASEDGTFTFENVELASNRLYVTSTLYRERTFGSSVISSTTPQVTESTTSLELPITIYELTEDPGVISIALIEAQISPAGDSLSILQTYRFRNDSDRLFTSSQQVMGSAFPSVAVYLPVGALVVGFDTEPRYIDLTQVQTDLPQPAFVDTRAVLPGEEHLVGVAYVLPYESGAVVEFPVLYPLEGQVRLLVDSSTFTLTSDQLQPADTEARDGSTYQVYEGNVSLARGDVVRYEISGSLPEAQSAESGVITSDVLLPLVIGIGVLIAALVIGLLVLQNRRSAKAAASTTNAQAEKLLRDIATLDAQHERGEINHDLYQQRRAALKAQLAEWMDEDKP
ncbi:MAG: hypothetical protein SF029_06015 [bacterium]|nr:hypothetical protein [bacterium]